MIGAQIAQYLTGQLAQRDHRRGLRGEASASRSTRSARASQRKAADRHRSSTPSSRSRPAQRAAARRPNDC
ncbi:hypothetical protein ACU4GD_27910 [Cupriavidus basilensis]